VEEVEKPMGSGKGTGAFSQAVCHKIFLKEVEEQKMDWISLIVFFVLVGAAGVFGGQWGANEWYERLQKPVFTPPNWLFPIAWTVLYAMIAIAGWRVWDAAHPQRESALGFWGLQLLLNAGWSYLFFGRRDLSAGLAGIAALWLSIAGFIAFAYPADETAALLFIPYLIWVSFAGFLNFTIWRMNPSYR
jgi:tryptophan-rich sensory protein